MLLWLANFSGDEAMVVNSAANAKADVWGISRRLEARRATIVDLAPELGQILGDM